MPCDNIEKGAKLTSMPAPYVEPLKGIDPKVFEFEECTPISPQTVDAIMERRRVLTKVREWWPQPPDR